MKETGKKWKINALKRHKLKNVLLRTIKPTYYLFYYF